MPRNPSNPGTRPRLFAVVFVNRFPDNQLFSHRVEAEFALIPCRSARPHATRLNNATQPVRRNLLWGWHIAAVVALVLFIGTTAPKHALPWGWTAAWCVAAATLAAAPLFPVIGLAVFVILAYGMPRYGTEFLTLLQLRILDAVSLLTVASWLIWASRARRTPQLRHWLIALMLAFSGWIVLTSVIAVAGGAPWEPFPRHNPMAFVSALVMFLVAAHVLGDKQTSWQFALALCLALLARALVQGTSGLDLEGDIAPLMVMSLPLALMGAWVVPQPKLRILFLALAVAMVGVVGLTHNRAAAVAGAVMLIVLVWHLRRRWRMLALGLLVVAAVVLVSSQGKYWQRFRALWDSQAIHATAQLDRATAEARLELWDAGLRIALDKPIVGVGPGNYPLVVGSYARGKDNLVAHNSYLNMAAETGFPGAALYIALFVGACWLSARVARRARNTWPGPGARTLQASLVAYLVVGMFISRHDMVLAYLLAGWAVALARQSPTPSGGTQGAAR